MDDDMYSVATLSTALLAALSIVAAVTDRKVTALALFSLTVLVIPIASSIDNRMS